jgi:hypothetical protein
MSPTDPVYPLPRPDDPDNTPFTMGLTFDVANVLAEHGYPTLDGPDLVRLQQALFGFLYGPGTDPAAAAAETPVELSERRACPNCPGALHFDLSQNAWAHLGSATVDCPGATR